ncbi:phosphatidate cytidylyltransferase [Amphiplicatus metriothermophilus]|uniref:Phosphatidate cytidylyltransferase n=2 Tax=Amphiplicatus metriothermophilus TaxID=1519374 RepID=A0A239PQC4_9PROT|nr:phosphatidate cytidylyltransferase [Amphiplicatus metriothermophilus]
MKPRIPALLRTSLAQRIASSLFLAPGALAAAYAGGAVFAAVVAFAAIVMVFEWTRMIEKREFSPAFYALAAAGAGALMLAAAGRFPIAFAICGMAALAAGALAARGERRPLWAAFAAAYILAPCAALIWLREAVENGRALTIMLLLIVWAADTGGYIGGRLVGGPKMNPVLSPAKTWAGAVGGVILGALAGLACARWIYGEGPLALYVLAGGCLGLASILGDMAESAFKRAFGVKDTSGFIPGHGGFLDRLDGMIFATTAMTLALFLHMIAGRING